MKKLLLGSIAIIALGIAPALAADMAVKARPAPVAMGYNWTGWYVGVNGGGEWGRSDAGLAILNNSYVPAATATILANGNNRINNSGGLVGGQFGYLWQSGAFVGGVEASIDWMGIRGSVTRSGLFGGAPFDTFNESVKTDWLALLLGRAGVDFNGWMPYVTGGLAVTNFRYSSTFTDILSPAASNASISQTRAGWAVGAGLEYRITPSWSLRGEYLYADFGSISGSSPVINPLTGVQYNLAGGGLTFQHSANLRENIARLALSYHFGGPAVGRY
jgi:outer membrane immunogenic protein